MNLPNKLTVARVCAIPFFIIALLGDFVDSQTGRYIALGIFICASFTDYLDGQIARSRNLVTNFGKLMDPIADKLLVASALIVLVELGSIPSWLVVIIISREFLISGMRLVALSENSELVIAAAMPGKIKTVSQMLMIVFLLIDFKGAWVDYATPAFMAFVLFFTIASAFDYVVKNISIFKDL